MCFCSRHYCKMRMCNKNTPCFNLLFLWSHVHSLPSCKQYAHNEHLTFTLTKSFLSDFANLKSDNSFNHQDIDIGLGLGICYLTPLSTIFQLYRGSQFYWWRKPEYPDENHQPVANHWQTLSHNVSSSTNRDVNRFWSSRRKLKSSRQIDADG